MTIKEAATYLGLSPATVRRMCNRSSPVLRHARVGPRRGRIVITREELDRHLREGTVERSVPAAAQPRRQLPGRLTFNYLKVR